jgi:hypothetical protein
MQEYMEKDVKDTSDSGLIFHYPWIYGYFTLNVRGLENKF